MICVSVTLDGDGCLRGFTAGGHSFLRGKDFSPVCAAVSALLRTAAELFVAEDVLGARVSLPEEGKMEVTIAGIPTALTERCRGITDFLVCALARIAAEEPDDLDLKVVQ
ncbi:MAG: ribosomal-processing cysteine protease Prp [Spirochaetaceae bacterium]|nr:ribosomal-processing cysteine protease Prp [Spirochaetaceae bacterium]